MARLVKMGAQAVGEGAISATPEYAAAVALAAALHDPAFWTPMTWAVGLFQRPGEMPRFVIAGQEGASWTPPGLYLPDGVVAAHHDPSIDADVRAMWRGLPPAMVLAGWARINAEVPAVVVVREHEAVLHALFPRETVLVACSGVTPPDPNPLMNRAGRHRLQVSSPDAWWPEVVATPADQFGVAIRQVVAAVVEGHDAAGTPNALLRAAVVEQLRRGTRPTPELLAALRDEVGEARIQMIWARGPAAPTPPLQPGWNAGLVRAEQAIRMWECLTIALGEPTAERLADVTHAGAAAGLSR